MENKISDTYYIDKEVEEKNDYVKNKLKYIQELEEQRLKMHKFCEENIK